jgi:hypothetical protein
MIGTAIPFFKTYNNFVSKTHDSWVSPYGRPGKGANNIKNYMHNPDIQNLFEWYHLIQKPNGMPPSYDDTWFNSPNVIGIFDPKYNVGDSLYNMDVNNVDLRVDYLAALGGLGEAGRMRKATSNDLGGITQLNGSGNMVLRMNQDSAENRQYLMMLYENGVAHSASDFGGTHEDDDVGSFILGVDKDELAIDPSYLGWSNHKKTSKYLHHNVILFDNSSSMIDYFSDKIISLPSTYITDVKSSPNLQSFKLHIEYNPYFAFLAPNGPDIIREVNQIRRPNGTVYYILKDKAIGNTFTNSIQWQLNGNGSINEGFLNNASYKTFQQDTTGNNRIFKWLHPCSGFKTSGKWNMYANVGVLNGNANPPISSTITSSDENGTNTGNLDLNNSGMEYQTTQNGVYTRAMVKQFAEKTQFQTVIIPYRCNNESSLPIITKDENASHIKTTINFPDLADTSFLSKLYKKIPAVPSPNTVNDSNVSIHYSRWQGMEDDSLLNPFQLNSENNNWLKLNAQSSMVQFNSFAYFGSGIGYCPPSYSNFRLISIENGSYFSYKEKEYIRSTIAIDASIELVGRYYYKASMSPVASVNVTDTVQFFLPDVGVCIEMIALDARTNKELQGRFDSTTNILYLAIPSTETHFYIQEKLACSDCYFPPQWKNIDTLFNADDRNNHRLGHKLKISGANGRLAILNGTKIDMCSGVYLHNKSQMVIEGPCQTKGFKLATCNGIDSIKAYSNNSSITISSGSALILENGSSTYIKRGGAIYVKANGTLVIKNGAFVQIGDQTKCGWGEIIAEPGAFVYIEPGAHIEYAKTPGDTVDRNIFQISMANPPGLAFYGVHFLIDSLLIADSLLTGSRYSIDICELDRINPILNKEWGYTNFAKPHATFQTRNDTICMGEPFYIKLNRILNDAKYQIVVCRLDSIQPYLQFGNTAWQDTCIQDTIVQDSLLPDPVCKEPRNIPDDWTYFFEAGTTHRITINAWNDCGILDDTTVYIFVADTPQFSFEVPDSICEGFGLFTGQITNTFNQPVFYSLEISELVDTANIFSKLGLEANSFTKNDFGNLPDTISFNDYFFKGGRRYIVSLSVVNSCGRSIKYDTFDVKLGVNIVLERPIAYGMPIAGPTSVLLHGYTNSFDSIRWTPTTYLDNPTSLTPLSTPLESITYTLTAYKESCVASDSAHVKFNRYANAGFRDTICFDSNTISAEILIGFPYDMSLLIGALYYYNPSTFTSNYNTYNSLNSPEYFKYFTHFMHHWYFEVYAATCPVNLFTMITENMNKDIFFKANWYKGYYENFSKFDDENLNFLEIFRDTVENNLDLKYHLDSLNDWGNIDPCIGDIFSKYNDFVSSHLSEISVEWFKVTNQDTLTFTGITGCNNCFVLIDNPTQTSTYIMSVVTPDVAEIDEVTILFDTIVNPSFHPGLVFDSTVYFNNTTSPFSHSTTFEWNFGDGSSNSFEEFPIHTFPFFDTSYLVCLYAYNKCGISMFCDTIWIDSANWGGSFYTKNNSDLNNQNSLLGSKSKINRQLLNSNPKIELINYPNPFDMSTIIEYQILSKFSNALIEITNVLGQIVFSQSIIKPMDKIKVDGSILQNGIYTYSIIVDDSIWKTRKMVVMH